MYVVILVLALSSIRSNSSNCMRMFDLFIFDTAELAIEVLQYHVVGLDPMRWAVLYPTVQFCTVL